jgi:hypothetical protein
MVWAEAVTSSGPEYEFFGQNMCRKNLKGKPEYVTKRKTSKQKTKIKMGTGC